MRIAVDMVDEKLITQDEALLRVEPEQLEPAAAPDRSIPPTKTAPSRAAAAGHGPQRRPRRGHRADRASTPTTPKRCGGAGETVILVRIETSPEDIRGMDAAEGILTARGGMTSHAALVARQMGKVCVVGCEALQIDYTRARCASPADGRRCSRKATGSRSTAPPAR